MRWRKLGVWDKIFEAVSKAYDGDLQMVDASSIRVHHHAANVKKGAPDAAQGHDAPARCMGRSRGGLTTKLHALVDGNGLPITLKLSEGQAHDGRSAADMLGGLGPGQILLADRAYDSDALRARLQEQGAWANIKSMSNRLNITAFSPFLYRYRNLVERFFALVERAVAKIWTRFMSR